MCLHHLLPVDSLPVDGWVYLQMCEALCVDAVIINSEAFVLRPEKCPLLNCHLSLWSDLIIFRVHSALQSVETVVYCEDLKQQYGVLF